jgi:hypothetical protein
MTDVTGADLSSVILPVTLLPRFARHAVVPGWTRFISAFPARRFVQRKSKVNVSGIANSGRVSECVTTSPSRKKQLK